MDARIAVYGMVAAALVACIVNWRGILSTIRWAILALIAAPLWVVWGDIEIKNRLWRRKRD